MGWSRYLKFVLGSALMVAVVIYAFILVLDPYQNVPFSPALNRAPVSTNQRFSYPSIARDPGFDSVVIGTSTSRLLDPRLLGELTGASFAYLSMNSATAYEQLTALAKERTLGTLACSSTCPRSWSKQTPRTPR